MSAEKQLKILLRELKPTLNRGEFVFVSVEDLNSIDRTKTLCEFKEAEGTTIILDKKEADKLNLKYDYVASWITLSVHSALDAVGLTASFSKALAENNISANVVAGYYHDHIFVATKDADKTICVLTNLSKKFL